MLKKLQFLFAFATIFISLKTVAQPYHPYISIPVTQNGGAIRNPWVGGFDSPILQPIDLNGDGIKDLFVFEKGGASQTNFRYTTYINNGTPNQVDYQYAPQYKRKFPEFLHDWVLLVDYDCDGREDIFTYSFTGGMTVYHNDYSVASGLKFSLKYELVYSVYFGFPSNLFVSAVNQPALTDVDNDGDLDVLTFALTGNNVEFHQNLAMENFGRCDTLVYNMATACWGNFGLSGLSNSAIFNIACREGYHPGEADDRESHSLHSGSCALAPDLDGDGDKDFLNGDILGDNILYIQNTGTSTSAYMSVQDTAFPSYNTSINFRTFPATYYFDTDNDGNKDLISTGCIANASRNYNNVLFYKNTTNNTTNVFNYVKNSLYVEDMIEVGSGANVTLVDVDGDGLQDMIIGNYKYTNQSPPDYAALAYYRNTGTATAPSFNLETIDFANLTTVLFDPNTPVLGLVPTFGDVDGDGDKDMIVGTADGFLDYFINTGNATYVVSQIHMTASNGNPINVGSYTYPTLIDLDKDGRLDLVIGEKAGNLNYYQNTGTINSPSFTFVTDVLGGVNVTKQGFDIYGYSTPFFYNNGGSYELYVGSLSGYVYKYNDIDNNIAGNFNLVDSMFLYEPVRSTVGATDINGDGVVDLLVGNYAGGVTWYSNSTVSVNEIANAPMLFNLYPNPAKDVLYIKFENNTKNISHFTTITDVTGRIVYTNQNNLFTEAVDVKNWSNGLYVCKVVQDGRVVNSKFIIQH